MKRKIIIIIFSLIVLSGCGDTTTTNTYNSQGAISVDNSENDNSENVSGDIATSVKPVIDTEVDKSTNNITNSTPESSVIDSDEYKQLEKENADLRNQLEELESNNADIPTIEYKDLELSIEGEDIPINKSKSMIIVDGKEYVSKEIVDALIPENQNVTINDGTMYVGKVISDKANLFDQYIMDQRNFYMIDTITDSYNNNYSNVLYARTSYTGEKYIIYTLNRKYSSLKFTISIRDDAKVNDTGILTIKADDTVVYTSKTLDKKTEPFTEMDIPINNCNLLTIEYSPDYFIDCIISDAIVYN